MNIVPNHVGLSTANLKILVIPILLTASLALCLLLSRVQIFRGPETKRFSAENASNRIESKERAEFFFNELSNATKKLIAMERKAKRLEENIKRVKESTRNLLWRNKDKALWCILFKNVSCDVVIRHELHEHTGLKRILSDHRAWRHHRKHGLI